jgi:hypothetical protein
VKISSGKAASNASASIALSPTAAGHSSVFSSSGSLTIFALIHHAFDHRTPPSTYWIQNSTRVTVAGNSNPTHMNKTAVCTSALVMSTRNGAKHQNNSVDVGTLTAAPSHGGIHLNAT